MKFSSFSLGLILFLVCLVALPTPPLYAVERELEGEVNFSHQTTPLPYLMYFTTTPTPHFIIEQANGADSRIFGGDLMPPDANHVAGPGWSPSGDWFAWTANSLQHDYNTGDHPFVLSADGQTHVTALDGFNWAEIRWSATDDILLVAGLSDAPEVNLDATREPRNLNLVIGLLDPARDAWIARHDIALPEDTSLLYLAYELRWHPDQQSAVVLWRDFQQDAPTTHDFYIVRQDGTTDVTHFPDEGLIGRPQTYFDSPLILPFGEIISLSESGIFTLTNVIDGTEKDFAIPPDEHFLNLRLNEDGRLFIQTELNECAVQCQSAWVYDGESMTRLVQPNGFLTIVTPDRYGIVYTDGDNRVHYVKNDGTGVVDFDWMTDNTVSAPLQWNESGQAVIAVEEFDDELETYVVIDFSSTPPVEIGQFTTNAYDNLPMVSSGGHTAGYAFYDVTLVDVATGEENVLPPDPRTYFTSGRGEVTWHPTLPYAILWENALVAGGGYLRYTGIVSEDGTLKRGLGYCESPTEICADWLPDRIRLSKLAQGTDLIPVPPINRIKTGTWFTGTWLDELIWSPDGSQIAGGQDFRSMGSPVKFHVWEVVTGELITTFDEVAWEETIIWEGGNAQIAPREVAPPGTLPHILATSPQGTLQFTETDHFQYTPQLLDADGNVIAALDDYLQDWHSTASFSPTDAYVAIGSASNRVRILNSTTGEVLATLRGIPSNAVAFSPDGLYLAVAVSTEIHIYEVAALLK